MTLNRRDFVSVISAAAAGTALAPLANLNSRVAASAPLANMPIGMPTNREVDPTSPTSFSVPGFGPISPKVPNNTQELGNLVRLGDLTNVPLLALPEGFEYTAVSIGGQTNTVGEIIPTSHDGMAAYRGRGGSTILVRNHEGSVGSSSTLTRPNNGRVYDGYGSDGSVASGGTSNLVIDRNGRVVFDAISLGGTIRNCAGGLTPWDTWITCEENTTVMGENGATRMHGYNFEVPASATEAVDPVPLVAMGRMNHEAVAVDPRTSYCYETEDAGDSCFYRFVPSVRRARGAGDYPRGGELYAMRIVAGQVGINGEPLPTTGAAVDTRGLDGGAPASFLAFLGVPLAVDWVRLDDVDPVDDTLRLEAAAKGGALFFRGEGAWEHRGSIYFVCSNAGDVGEGQVMRYDPRRETVTMVVESTDENLLDGPDNITVGTDGTLYLCEDGSGGDPGAPNYSQRIVGVDQNGGLFNFALNVLDTAEFAGACFDANGRTMFVNSQGPAITYIIWRSDRRPIRL